MRQLVYRTVALGIVDCTNCAREPWGPEPRLRSPISIRGFKSSSRVKNMLSLSCHKSSSVWPRPRVDRTGLRPPHSLTSSCQASFIVSLVYGVSAPRVVNHAKERAKEMKFRANSSYSRKPRSSYASSWICAQLCCGIQYTIDEIINFYLLFI